MHVRFTRGLRRSHRPLAAALLLLVAALVEIAHSGGGRLYRSLNATGSYGLAGTVVALLLVGALGLALRRRWGWFAGLAGTVACVSHGAWVSISESPLGPLFLALGVVSGVLLFRCMPHIDPVTGAARWSIG